MITTVSVAVSPLATVPLIVTFTMLPFVLLMIWALDDHGPTNLKVARRR